MMECMLCYICNTQVGVLDHCTTGGGDLTREHLIVGGVRGSVDWWV